MLLLIGWHFIIGPFKHIVGIVFSYTVGEKCDLFLALYKVKG